MALNTEAQPLMPHAQGTRPGLCAARRDNASGNGIPMQNASGAISAREIGILAMSASGISRSKSGGRTNRCAKAPSAMPATATVIRLHQGRDQDRVSPVEQCRTPRGSPLHQLRERAPFEEIEEIRSVVGRRRQVELVPVEVRVAIGTDQRHGAFEEIGLLENVELVG